MDSVREQTYGNLEKQIGGTPLYVFGLPNGHRVYAKAEFMNPTGSHYDRVYIKLLKEFRKIKLDKIDKQILQILAKKADTPTTDISQYIKLTPEAIRRRIKNLESKKIILGYRTMINPLKLKRRLF